jgi:CBS domain containing-hemolysin-like protein
MKLAALPTFRIPEQTCVPQAVPLDVSRVTPESPALSVMTDLTRVRAATVGPDISLHDAEQTMIHQGVRLLFVVTGFPCVDGLVTFTDLSGERPLRVVQQRGAHFEDLRVADVMTPLPDIDVIDFELLQAATVAHVILTFKAHGRRHLLVVQGASADAAPRIRGVLSLAQLERQLGHVVDATEIARSFAEIQRALN